MNDMNENVNTLEYNTDYNANVGKKSTGLGLASMLIGILGIFLCCCVSVSEQIWLMCGMLGIFVAGLMMGIVAVMKDSRRGLTNGMAIAGIILCGIQSAAVILIIFAVLFNRLSY